MISRNILIAVILLTLNLTAIMGQDETIPAAVSIGYEDTAHEIFSQLYNNDASVISNIDWNDLVIEEDSVGLSFGELKSEADKIELQARTIRKISSLIQDDIGPESYNKYEYCTDIECIYYLCKTSESREIYFAFHLINNEFLLFRVNVYNP